jgi:SAM-dependent methyltransferase
VGPPDEPQTWHHGVVARWWAEFNRDGPEIAYFQRHIQESGQPALDVACGTGRLLIPFLHAGLDVDGCDVSADMLALCRERAEREGLSPTLYHQAMHQLDLPRRYRTIVVCGGFGLGGNRRHDVQALRQFHDLLEPGGLLVLDNEVPYANRRTWRAWTRDGRSKLPEAWPDKGDRRTAEDGTQIDLRARVADLDPLAQRLTFEMRGALWRDGKLVTQDDYTLLLTMYFTDELVLLLEQAGFRDIVLTADYTDDAPSSDTEFVVFAARKPLDA